MVLLKKVVALVRILLLNGVLQRYFPILLSQWSDFSIRYFSVIDHTMPWSKDITDKSWQIKPINPADCMGLVNVGQYGTAIIRQTSLLCDINMYWKQRCRWLDSWIKTYLRDLKLIIIRTQFYFMCWKCEFPGLFTFKYCPMYLNIVCYLRISRHERRKALVAKFAVWIKINPFYDQRFLLQSAKNSVAILICRYFIMIQ